MLFWKRPLTELPSDTKMEKSDIANYCGSFVWDIPPTWSLREAASVPVAYSTAYLALIIRGNIKQGKDIKMLY